MHFYTGDKVYYTGVAQVQLKDHVGTVTAVGPDKGGYTVRIGATNSPYYLHEEDLELVERSCKEEKTPTGGPSSYYDFPFQDWVTLNDQIEYLGEYRWGKYAVHLKDIFKGLGRWGGKDGTTLEYDAKKIIYYGCRVLMMIVGVNNLREYLKELLADKQFEEKRDV